ncbi:MAG: hypothetical protein JXA09_12735 [Anaerolineae bacterium]|nr:hypothetical protein [Anaerolineae bacterium]
MKEAVQDWLPQIPFGAHRLSRLILGANPINGGSHLSRFVNRQMRRYFTPERVQELLRQCQSLGINAWQSGPVNLDAYLRFRESGGEMHYISLAQPDREDPALLRRLVAAGTIGIAHHGEVTDVLWKRGEIDQVRAYCALIRDTGAMVGISTHIPDVVDYVVSAGWDVDFMMCCVYERHRTREELKALLGDVPLPPKEVYLEGDPPRMFRVMRQTDKPCLAFKILAAGRLSDREEWVAQAFESTFRQIKANDAVIVGMYPEYEDQPAINAAYVRRFSALSAQYAPHTQAEHLAP